MFKDLGIRTKLTFPIVILAIIFIILTQDLIRIEYSKYQSLLKLQEKIVLATVLSKLLHTTQIERGLSTGFLTTKGRQFHEELLKHRLYTDEKMDALYTFLNSTMFQTEDEDSTKKLSESLSKALKSIKQISSIRRSIDTMSMTGSDAITFYTKLNSHILDITVEITKSSDSHSVTQDIIAYSNFLHLKENTGIERAVGTDILSVPIIDQSEINLLNRLVSKEELYKRIFLQYASDDFTAHYKQFFRGPSLEVVANIREVILRSNREEIATLDNNKWFKNSTLRIDKLKGIDDYLSKRILANIEKSITTIKMELAVVVILNLASIVIFVFMMIFITRLLKSEQKLKGVINEYVISSTTDLDGIITEASAAFCAISGYTQTELIGSNHNKIRHEDMSKETFSMLWSTIRSGKVWHGEVKNRQKDGNSYWVKAIISPLYDNGKHVGYSALRYDITDKKKLEALNNTLEQKISQEVDENRKKDQQMLQQSRLAQMGEMISMIAHQWRQPLAAISNTSSALTLKAKRHRLDDETTIKLSGKILEYSEHLSTTINDFRNFFKANKQSSETSYTELVQSVLNIIEVSVTNHNIKLITELHCDDTFNSYPNELKQVLLNLIKNAEDALLENKIQDPYIKISTYKKEDSLRLTVTDNGGGIPNDIVEKVFDPYFSTKTDRNGTGLGLYMSKTIIEDHCGGRLSLHSNSYGVEFIIELPVTTADIKRGSSPALNGVL